MGVVQWCGTAQRPMPCSVSTEQERPAFDTEREDPRNCTRRPRTGHGGWFMVRVRVIFVPFNSRPSPETYTGQPPVVGSCPVMHTDRAVASPPGRVPYVMTRRPLSTVQRS
jgi:hypothetical protein